MRKYPSLSFASGGPPSEVPAEVIAFANEDGAHQVLFASGGRAGERIFKELPGLGFARHVWPRFLRENAARVFGLA
jgi:hypothetical protein